MVAVTMPVPNPATVMFAGDWHGSFDAANAALQSAAANHVDVVVQLGDFGFWHGRDGAAYLDSMSARATQLGVPIVWLDGNHEDFTELLALPVDPVSGLRPIRENMWHVPRGSRWEWNGLRFAALGGATSLDRLQRSPGRSWWPEEAITMQEAYATAADGECDVFLTHDCPEGVPIPGIDRASSLRYWPESELRVAWAHREQLADITAALKPALLVHGHFHIRYDTVVEEFGTQTTVVGLSEDGTGMGNRWIATDADIAALVTRNRLAADHRR